MVDSCHSLTHAGTHPRKLRPNSLSKTCANSFLPTTQSGKCPSNTPVRPQTKAPFKTSLFHYNISGPYGHLQHEWRRNKIWTPDRVFRLFASLFQGKIQKMFASALRVDFSLKNVLIWPKRFYDLLINNSDFGKIFNIWNASRCWKTNQTKKRNKTIICGCCHVKRDLKQRKVRDHGEKGGHHLILKLQIP